MSPWWAEDLTNPKPLKPEVWLLQNMPYFLFCYMFEINLDDFTTSIIKIRKMWKTFVFLKNMM